MAFDKERWLELRPLLDRVLDLPVEERGPWLASLREREPGLAVALEDLLDDADWLDSIQPETRRSRPPG